MASTRKTFLRCLTFFTSWGGLLLWPQSMLLAADPIQVYGQTNKVLMPKLNSSEPTQGKRNDFLNPESNWYPTLEAPSSDNKNTKRDKRLQDLLDKQRNWIFRTPDSFTEERAPEDMFNLKEDEWTGVGNKSSKTVERFWREQDRKQKGDSEGSSKGEDEYDSDGKAERRPGHVSNRNSKQESEPDEIDRPARVDFPFSIETRSSSKESPGLNWSSLFKSTGPAKDSNLLQADGFSSSFSRTESSSHLFSSGFGLSVIEKSGTQKQLETEFKQLLDRSAPKTVLPAAFDPINFIGDATRQEIHPVEGKSIEVFSGAGAKFNPFIRLPGNNAGLPNARPGFLDDLNPKFTGPANSTPGFVPPMEPRIIQPMPSMLEMPKRKF